MKKDSALARHIKKAAHKEFVGSNLIDARKALRLRQADMARRLGIASNKLAQWESGQHYPDPWIIKQFCDETGFTTDWFYRRIRAGVSAELADDLRRVEAEAEEA